MMTPARQPLNVAITGRNTMKKVFAGLLVAVVTALMSLAFTPTANAAYPDTCPNSTTQDCTSPPIEPDEDTIPPTTDDDDVQAASESTSSSILPNTGGPEGVLLVGGVALLAVGGAAVVVARRRQTR